MKQFLAVLFFSIVAPLHVMAQSTDPATKAILDAIQGLNSRLDGMQKDIDGLKGGAAKSAPQATAPAPSATTPPATQPSTSGPKVQGKLRPGWVVNAYNKKADGDGNFDSDAVVTFVWPRNNFNKNIHEKSYTTTNSLSYRAEAYFRAKEDGRFVFIIRNESTKSDSTKCRVILIVDDRFVIQSNFGFWGKNEIIQGGIDLLAGDFRIRFEHICNLPHISQVRR